MMRRWAIPLAAMATTGLLLGMSAVVTHVSETVETNTPVPADLPSPNDDCNTDAALRYVAGGDAVAKGSKNNDGEDQDASIRYSEQLLSEHLQPAPGPWCLFNTSKNLTNTDTYQDEGSPTQQSQANDLRPRLITLTLGEQNDVINDTVTTCFKNVKDHDFIEANACALKVLADGQAWDKLRNDLSDILNRYKVQMDGNPDLVVAVTGYYNPYPSATSVLSEVPGFCAKLQDTIPTCTIRWILLPPALVTLDQVIKKLNSTIEGVVKQFTTASQGRYFFVNPYDKFKDHCMQMEVEIKTKVYHPTNTVHDHNSKNDFGCDDPWIVSDGTDGTKSPFPYLTPAVTGVLILATQTTKGMGIYPNEDGHDCISDLIFEANNGWGILKNKLGIPEPAEEPCDG
jgi:hypothetical protein